MEEITLEYAEQIVEQLSVEEQKQRDLYGIWKGQSPDDFDIDAVLYEIRHEWEKEFEEIYGRDHA